MQDIKPKIELQSIKVKVRLSLTADDWQLYSNVSGRNLAARRLNRAVEKKLAKGEINSITDVLNDYSKWGASDSEGYSTIYQIMRKLGFLSDQQYF